MQHGPVLQTQAVQHGALRRWGRLELGGKWRHGEPKRVGWRVGVPGRGAGRVVQAVRARRTSRVLKPTVKRQSPQRTALSPLTAKDGPSGCVTTMGVKSVRRCACGVYLQAGSSLACTVVFCGDGDGDGRQAIYRAAESASE